MALFVYMTERCEQDIHRHSISRAVERFRQRLLDAQRTNLFDNFPPPYMKKRFSRQIRLIAHQYPFGEHLVVCFLRLLVRGSSDYQQGFLNDPKGYGDSYLAPLVDTESLGKWLNEQLKEAPPPQKPDPTENERRYLWDVLGGQFAGGPEVFVCESEDWVRAVSDKRLRMKLVLLADPILTASEDGTEENCIITVPGRSDVKMIGRYFPEHSKLFLAAVLTTDFEQEAARMRERYAPILTVDPSSVTEELILQHSMRAYPNELLLDEDLWIDVEKDEASNLALSPEETSILESVHNLSTGEESVGFPLFINGRAGSGKSTILQYLFADYLRLYFSIPETPGLRHPLYFTCSGDLLQRSRKVVGGLVTCGHRHVVRRDAHANAVDPEHTSQALSTCFREFHEFLYSLLPPQDRSGSFRRNTYVDYARFKGLWQEKFGRDPKAIKSYGADVSWHVIRSYIKGLSADGYLDPEEYGEQPAREQTVSAETFSVIHEKVWNNWYRPLCEDGEHWDDQDLARKLLDDEFIAPEYPAIFCDEAQDFTRLELEAIFRLSLFSDRRLASHELNRVPFAFAGDPFQTLNPTGFRWDAIKSAFVLKFLRSLDPACQSGITDLNYQELSFNYRSTKNVVRLCNGIQALRSVLFDIPNMKPQTTWQFEPASPMPVWFERGKGDVLDALRKEGDLTIIIPCQEGEEISFVDNDEFLSSAVQRDDTGVPQNVLSATRAKGLEFSRVVLYGFGEECRTDLLAPITGGNSYADTAEKALPHEYFVNRLYVAASRPKLRLFVIDTADGLRRLWSFATDLKTQEAMLNRLRHNPELWRTNIGILQPGVARSWTSDREDLKEIAERYEREGRASMDSYMLRSAAMSYQNMGDQFRARQCRAFALLFEREYSEAGQAFVECEDYDRAIQALWEGSEYRDIVSLGKTAPQLHARIEHRVADFFLRAATPRSGLELLQLIEEQLSETAFQDQALSSQAWSAAIAGIFDRLAGDRKPGRTPGAWGSIAQAAVRLSSLGFSVAMSHQGMLSYRAEEWSRAISCWESCKETHTAEFRDAKAHVLIAEIEAGRKTEPDSDEARILADHYTKAKQCSLAVSYWARARDEKGLARVCSLALDIADNTAALAAIAEVLAVFTAYGHWSQMVNLVSDGRWPLIQGDRKKAFRALVGKEAEHVLGKAALLLARSDLLPEANSPQQKEVSEFLKLYFIKNGTSWARHTTPDVAGAAIERAGRVIDALQFYEIVMATATFTSGQKKRAKKRWVKNKYRQAKFEEVNKKHQRAHRHTAEADDKANRWEISNVNALPEYPDVRDLTEPVGAPVEQPTTPRLRLRFKSKTAPTQKSDEKCRVDEPEPTRNRPTADGRRIWTVGDLAFRYSSEAGRVNVEHQQTLETATIKVTERTCASGDVDFGEETGEPNVFTCPKWQMQCDLREVLQSGFLTLRFIEADMQIRLRVAQT